MPASISITTAMVPDPMRVGPKIHGGDRAPSGSFVKKPARTQDLAARGNARSTATYPTKKTARVTEPTFSFPCQKNKAK